MPSLLNQSPSKSSHLIDTPDAPDSPPLGVHKYPSDDARIASVGELPRESLMYANDKIFGVYQDWLQQNTGTHLDGGIEEDGNRK